MRTRDWECRWCGHPFWKSVEFIGRVPDYSPHACPNKPPQTAEEGAAVAFGLMGMAEEIRKYVCWSCGDHVGRGTTCFKWDCIKDG